MIQGIALLLAFTAVLFLALIFVAVAAISQHADRIADNVHIIRSNSNAARRRFRDLSQTVERIEQSIRGTTGNYRPPVPAVSAHKPAD